MIELSLLLTLAPLTAAAPASPVELDWFQGTVDEAVTRAKHHDSHVLIYFWRDGSESSGKFYEQTLLDARTPEAIGDMVLYSANYDNPIGGELFARYQVSTLPTVLFLAPDGKVDDAVLGYSEPDSFLEEVARIRRGEGTRRGLEAALASAKPRSEEAIEILWKLAGKRQDLGDQEGHDAALASLREEHDPKGKTVVGARAHLWKVSADLREQCEACACEGECGEDCNYAASLAKLDLKPIYEFAKKVKPTEIRFEAWSSVADLEAGRHDTEKAVQAFEKAAKYVPAKQAVTFPKKVAWWAIEAGEEATKEQRKLALEFARLATKNAEACDPTSEDYGDSYGETPVEHLRAEALGTLAFALHLNGEAEEAKAQAEAAIALAGSDDYRAFFAPILEG